MATIEQGPNFDVRAEIEGMIYWARQDLRNLPGKLWESSRNVASALNERRYPDSAFWRFNYERGQDMLRESALVNPLTGIAMIDSMRYHADRIPGVYRREPPVFRELRRQVALFQIGQFEAVQNEALSLNDGEEMIFFSPCGQTVDDRVAIVRMVRNGDKFKAESRLLPSTTDHAARILLEEFKTSETQVVNLDPEEDSSLFLIIRGCVNSFDLQNIDFEGRNNYHLAKLGEQPTTTKSLGACQSISQNGTNRTGCKERVCPDDTRSSTTSIVPPLPLFITASLPPSEFSLIGLRTFFLPSVRSLPNTRTKVKTESGLVFEEGVRNQETQQKPSEVGSLKSQPERMDRAPLVEPTSYRQHNRRPSMFQIAKESLERAPVSESLPQRSGESRVHVSMIQFIDTKPLAGEGTKDSLLRQAQKAEETGEIEVGVKLKSVAPQSQPLPLSEKENGRIEVAATPSIFPKEEEVKPQDLGVEVEIEQSFLIPENYVGLPLMKMEQAREKVMMEPAKAGAYEVAGKEKVAKKTTFIPLIEIPAYIVEVETGPLRVNCSRASRAEEIPQAVVTSNLPSIEDNPVSQGEEEKVRTKVHLKGVNLDKLTEEKGIIYPQPKQVLEGKSKILRVRSFQARSLSYIDISIYENRKTERKIRKLVWVVRPVGDQTYLAVLELELPKDQNQRLYAFLHFLRQVVKKIFGEDILWTSKIRVIRADEPVEVDRPLEILGEIKYYLSLLRQEDYAQVFAIVN